MQQQPQEPRRGLGCGACNRWQTLPASQPAAGAGASPQCRRQLRVFGSQLHRRRRQLVQCSQGVGPGGEGAARGVVPLAPPHLLQVRSAPRAERTVRCLTQAGTGTLAGRLSRPSKHASAPTQPPRKHTHPPGAGSPLQAAPPAGAARLPAPRAAAGRRKTAVRKGCGHQWGMHARGAVAVGAALLIGARWLLIHAFRECKQAVDGSYLF